MPKKYDNEFVEGINDPYLQSYLTHPAFAYYPVTNLTWEQIQNYLAWKTDRLNEEILIKKGFLNPNPNQQNEDNFNTDCDGFIAVTLTREDIANIVGTAKEACIRTLSSFKKEKMITTEGKRIKIIDKKALYRLIEGF